MAAEAEGVVDDGVDFHLAGGVWHVVEVAFGIGFGQIDGRWDDLGFDGFSADGHFNGSRGPEHVAGRAFCRTNGKLTRMIAEDGLDSLGFANVSLGRGGPVGVDVTDVRRI